MQLSSDLLLPSGTQMTANPEDRARSFAFYALPLHVVGIAPVSAAGTSGERHQLATPR
jgi:hypothetical protein